MKYRSIPAQQLTAEQLAAWSRLRDADDHLDSPCLSPEFTLAVAACREGTEVAVLEDDGQCVGFLPYHRQGGTVGGPVAGTLTDFQAAAVQSGVVWDPLQLVRGCGLKAMYFDHLLASQAAWRPFHCYTESSPYLDLSAGFPAYARSRNQVGSDVIRRVLQKLRKLEREVGTVRLAHFVEDHAVFDRLIAWKQDQYLRTKARDHLAAAWVVPFLERLHGHRGPRLSGILSVLYAGDETAAIHFGMLAAGVLHYWFTAYNVRLQRYSPGLIQLIRTAQDAASLGIRRIDLGKGPEAFKYRLMSGQTWVAEGALDLRPVIRPLKRLWLGTEHYVRHSVWYRPALTVVRNLRAIGRRSRTWWDGPPSIQRGAS